MKKVLYHIVIIFLFSISQNSLFAQSYYLLEEGEKWTYNFIDYATSDTNRTNLEAMLSGVHSREQWAKTEVTYQVRKDSTVNGKSYKVITNTQNPFDVTLIREENGNYFKLNNVNFKEENFLKTNVNVDDVWLDYENQEQTMATIYMVLAKEDKMTIKGKTFENVIGIGHFTASVDDIISFLQNDDTFMPVKYYAQDKGMIYSYEPYPLGGTYSDLEKMLVD